MHLELSDLGKRSEYVNEYKPSLLFTIPRQLNRSEIGVNSTQLPFYGYDIWNHFEVSWLNIKGKPQVAMAIIKVPANSPNIIESKSLKLYFNSFNNYRLASQNKLLELIRTDLSTAVEAEISVELLPLTETNSLINSICIDDLDVVITDYTVNPTLLKVDPHREVSEQIYSNLLKSNCPVTQQPDWATVIINYTGPVIEHAALLKYIISFRNHNEFHEQCVERIFCDILQYCKPCALTVSARFTRRGGIDINPVRSTQPDLAVTNQRLIRQ